MWVSFFVACLIAVAVLYLPGFFLFRSILSSSIFSFLLAPLYSLFGYIVFGYIYIAVGIVCTANILFWPVLIIGAMCFVVRICLLKKTPVDFLNDIFKKTDYFVLLLYVLLAFVLFLIFYIRPIGGPEGFINEFDNYFHLNTLYQFNEAIEANKQAGRMAISLQGYPIVWHLVAFIVIQFSNCSITIGSNAFDLVIGAVLFPSGIYLFLSLIFKRMIVKGFGAIAAVAFTAFPWGFLHWGPMPPNFLGYSFIPIIVSLAFILLFKAHTKVGKLGLALLALIALFVVGLSHQNAIFSSFIPIVVLVCVRIWKIRLDGFSEKRTKLLIKVIIILGTLLLAAVAWYAMYKLPMLKNVVNYEWAPFASKSQSIVNLALIGYNERSFIQPLLGVVVFLGFVYASINRKYAPILLPYIFVSLLYVFGSSSDGEIRHLLIGFWYTDTWRISGMLAIFGIPVASMGLTLLYDFVKRLLMMSKYDSDEKYISYISALAVSACFIGANFCPNFTLFKSMEEPDGIEVNTAFGVLAEEMQRTSSMFYDFAEKNFVKEVSEIVHDSKVLNDPYDGSGYLKPVDNIDVYFDKYLYYDKASNTDEIALLRHQLKDYASNAAVRDILKENDIKYLLLLDDPNGDYPLTREWDLNDPKVFDDAAFRGQKEEWDGYYSIDSTTPGFELVLSEGDMRLYRLTDVDR